MTNTSFYNMFKYAMESMKENSMSPLLGNDSDNQHYAKQESIAEAQYLQLDLSVNQKEIVNQLLDARDRERSEYSNLSYLAGIIDCIKFLKYLNVSIEGILKDMNYRKEV